MQSKQVYVDEIKEKSDIIGELHEEIKDSEILPLKKGGPVSLCSNNESLGRPSLDTQEKSREMESTTVVSIAEYRDFLDDYKSADHIVIQRLQYIEAWCTNIISDGLEKYVKKNKKNK